MALKANTLSYFQELQALKELDVEQSEAFLDLLVYAVLADGTVSEEELEQLDEEILRLPFLWDADNRDRIVAHSAKTRAFLEKALEDEETIERFVEVLAESIDDEDLRLVALRMFTAITFADGVDLAEQERCRGLGRAFGLSEVEVEAIVDEVAHHMED